ncbi:MAG: LacI family DNA-binding transcriptional regulator [Oxalobacteraceae bacterium]|nr:MAG: LacI family DNA-binding transcriptional regulator [Oxalobacteraceae bacterium]
MSGRHRHGASVTAISARAGISSTTVARVLNHRGVHSPETVARVREAQRQLVERRAA